MESTVIVYTGPGCGRCVYLKDTLNELKMPFVEKSITDDGVRSYLSTHAKDFKSLPIIELVEQRSFYSLEEFEMFLYDEGGE